MAKGGSIYTRVWMLGQSNFKIYYFLIRTLWVLTQGDHKLPTYPKNDLELLASFSQELGLQWALPHPVYEVLEIKPRTSCMLDKHSTELHAKSQHSDCIWQLFAGFGKLHPSLQTHSSHPAPFTLTSQHEVALLCPHAARRKNLSPHNPSWM